MGFLQRQQRLSFKTALWLIKRSPTQHSIDQQPSNSFQAVIGGPLYWNSLIVDYTLT